MSNHECSNCDALDHSFDQRPAVPLGGSCTDILHVCPVCGKRWWQFNTHFHLWKNVADDREWEALREQVANPTFEDW